MFIKQWLRDKLFALLTWLSPTEQPTPGELRAWALEEAQKPPQPQIWYDPTVRSYPQQEPPPPRTNQVRVLHLRTGEWSRQWREAHGMKPKQEVVRTNTEPLDEEKDFPPWLTGKDDTRKVPAIDMQEFHKRHAG